MAEPVSITAGVLGIVRVSVSLLKTLKSAAATPQELVRLQAELEHLGDVIQEVEKLDAEQGHMTDSLVKNMNSACVKVQEIQTFIDSRMYRANTEPAKIRRTALLREGQRLRGFTKDIEPIRIRLVDCLAISNL